jgi:hypothetical protein
MKASDQELLYTSSFRTLRQSSVKMQNTKLESMLDIPYLEGQASPLGCDCLGFVSLYFGLDLKKAYGMGLEDGVSLLSEIGFSESEDGNLALMLFNGGAYHLGIIENSYVYHASKSRGKVVRDCQVSFSVFIYKRFELNGSRIYNISAILS